MAFSPDGTQLVSGAADWTVRLAGADVSALAQCSRDVSRLAAASLHAFGLALDGVQLVEVQRRYLTPVNGYEFPVPRPFQGTDPEADRSSTQLSYTPLLLSYMGKWPAAPPPRRKPWATASRSLGSGAAGVRACRLVALPLPDPGRATGPRPLIGPRMRLESSGLTTTSGFLDCPLTQLYFRRAD